MLELLSRFVLRWQRVRILLDERVTDGFALGLAMPDDAAALLALRNRVYPEYATEPPQLHLATQLDAPRAAPRRYVVVNLASNRLAAYAATWRWAERARKYRMDLVVDPCCRCRGLGAVLFDRLVADLRAERAATLQARVRSDQIDALAFLRRRGFATVQYMDALALDVTRVDLARLAGLAGRRLAAGLRILSLSEAGAQRPDWLAELHALQNAVAPDWPDPDPAPMVMIPFDAFARRLRVEVRDRDGFFVALSGARFVGYSDISGFGTAVHPDFRGRGLATALKARVVAHAKQRQLPRLYTCTASPAMRAINEKLGYVLVRSEIRLLRALGQPPTA
jgi:GNAT superfamily N-acetyltransferase